MSNHHENQEQLEHFVTSSMAERIAVTAAKVAAETSLNELLATLGVARGNVESMNELRADLMFIRSIRQGSVKAGARFLLTIVTLFAGAFAYAAVDWARHTMGKG